MKKIVILNGPNLNWLGKREPEIYGNQGLDDMINGLRQQFPKVEIEAIQSNVEGELINCLQQAENDDSVHGIVFNAGGYTHTSIALADTLKAMDTPVILVHLSNIYEREPERHTDLLLANAHGCVLGLGRDSYVLAVSFFLMKNEKGL
jgi:3-dehydroquinate dehydratase-2